jgi:hypothetical protein
MTTLSDQFSAVRKAQFEAQFDFFQSFTSQALDSASRVAALNLALSRDTVQRSLGAGFALANSRDPRDVLTLGGQAEEQVRSLFAYGRELLGIAAGVRPYAALPQSLPRAPQVAVETVEVIERGMTETVAEAAPAAAAPLEAPVEQLAEAAPVAAEVATSAPVVVAEPEAAPEALAAAAEPVPVAEPKAIAKAVGKGMAAAAAVPHPAAAPVAELSAAERKVPAPSVSSKRRK